MTKRLPKPRQRSFMEKPITNIDYPDGTWLEGEEFTYPSGGWDRRALALCEDGAKRVFQCTIPDTYFSIPARGWIDGRRVTGFLSSGEQGLKFTQTKER
jgi:hypothetical protein